MSNTRQHKDHLTSASLVAVDQSLSKHDMPSMNIKLATDRQSRLLTPAIKSLDDQVIKSKVLSTKCPGLDHSLCRAL